MSLVAHRSHQRVITRVDSSSAPSPAFLSRCTSMISKLTILWWLRLDQALGSCCCHFREHVDQILRILPEPPCPEIPFLGLQLICLLSITALLPSCFVLLLSPRDVERGFVGDYQKIEIFLSLTPDVSWDDLLLLLFLFHNISISQRRWHLSVL